MENMLQLFNIVLFWIFAGLVCAWVAPKKGRHPGIWFLLGVLFSIFAVGTLLLLPRVQKQRKRPQPPAQPLLPSSEVVSKVWFYLDNTHQQQGPVDFKEIEKILSQKIISTQSYVWSDGMENWQKINELPDVVKELSPKQITRS